MRPFIEGARDGLVVVLLGWVFVLSGRVDDLGEPDNVRHASDRIVEMTMDMRDLKTDARQAKHRVSDLESACNAHDDRLAAVESRNAAIEGAVIEYGSRMTARVEALEVGMKQAQQQRTGWLRYAFTVQTK